MTQLALFDPRPPCLCLLGEQDSAPPGHPGACIWTCRQCDDTGTCGTCIAIRLTERYDRTWSATLHRWVVTVPTLYGLFEGAQGYTIRWRAPDRWGRQHAYSALDRPVP